MRYKTRSYLIKVCTQVAVDFLLRFVPKTEALHDILSS